MHPGAMLLEEFLKPLGLTQVDAARELGMSVNRLNELVLGKRGVTADTALRLARRFKTTPQVWMARAGGLGPSPGCPKGRCRVAKAAALPSGGSRSRLGYAGLQERDAKRAESPSGPPGKLPPLGLACKSLIMLDLRCKIGLPSPSPGRSGGPTRQPVSSAG